MNPITKKEAEEVMEEKSVVTTEPEESVVPKKVSALQATAQMVARYSNRLVGNERAQQFVATLSLMVKQNPKIAHCTPESLGTAMMACVHLDLMPNTPSQHAFVIPYMNNKINKYEAQFQIGYKGILELAYRTGQIKSIASELVFPEDKFKVELGTTRKLKHSPSFEIDRTVYKNATHVYATAALLSGESVFVVMGKSELDKVQRTAKAKSTDSPWNTWPEEMAKKTVVKRLLKMLPSSAADQRIALASAVDSWAQTGRLALQEGDLVETQGESIESQSASEVSESKFSEETLEQKMGGQE